MKKIIIQKIIFLLYLLNTASVVFSQTFTVYQNGSYVGTYPNSLTAVYESAKRINSEARSGNNVIYSRYNGGKPRYYLFQGYNPCENSTLGFPNYYTESESVASSYLYSCANAYVFKSDGEIFGTRINGTSPNVIIGKVRGETGTSNASKFTTQLSYWINSMTATVDFSNTAYYLNPDYPENLYVYGAFGWDDGYIELGFIRTAEGADFDTEWELYVAANRKSNSLAALSINGVNFTYNSEAGEYQTGIRRTGYRISKNRSNLSLEWRLSYNTYKIFIDGKERFSISCNEEHIRTHHPRFYQMTSMCPNYPNQGDLPKTANKITNMGDGTFFGPVHLRKVQIHFISGHGNPSNFWRTDGITAEANFVSDHTCKVIENISNPYSGEETITLSRNGSFSTTCNIKTSSSPYDGGSTSGGGTKTVGTFCTVIATKANSNYTFRDWTENGLIVSTNPSYTFKVSPARNLVANFTINQTSPCDNIINIAGRGSSYTKIVTLSGNGSWASNPCYSSPGKEKIFSFTPSISGTYNLVVTSANGWVDYLWKSGSCSSSGWNCIKDINRSGSYSIGKLTAGTKYLFLLDAENNSSTTHSFYIDLLADNACKTIPDYDYSLTPTTSWQTNSQSIQQNGCKIYKFFATEKEKFSFKTGCGADGATANFDTYLEIFDNNGIRRAYNDDACNSTQSNIDSWECTNSGYYYLKVRGYASYHYGNYSLSYKKTSTIPSQTGSGGVSIDNITATPTTTISSLSQSFTLTVIELRNRTSANLARRVGFALYNSTGVTEIGYSPARINFDDLQSGWGWPSFPTNISLRDFGLTSMPSAGNYRIYPVVSEKLSSPYLPYTFIKGTNNVEKYVTITVSPMTFKAMYNENENPGDREKQSTDIDVVIVNQPQIFITRNNIEIKSDLNIMRLELFSLGGTKLFVKDDFSQNISISHLPAGIYILKIITENGSFTNKIVKQ